MGNDGRYNGHNVNLLQMGWCVWLEETVPGRVGWRSSTTATGGRCATTAGASSMQRWSAGSWATGVETLCANTNEHSSWTCTIS